MTQKAEKQLEIKILQILYVIENPIVYYHPKEKYFIQKNPKEKYLMEWCPRHIIKWKAKELNTLLN